jgi:predicted DsbA family dithiol-disulfide isomerase
VPPHQLAKAAARYGEEAFRRMHDRLLRAYFGENRDISDTQTLRSIWGEVGLPEEGFAQREDPALLEQILDEHSAALEAGASGVPAVQLAGNPAIVVGAHPLELYRRWLRRILAASDEPGVEPR